MTEYYLLIIWYVKIVCIPNVANIRCVGIGLCSLPMKILAMFMVIVVVVVVAVIVVVVP